MRLSHSAFALLVAAFAVALSSSSLPAADEEKKAAAPVAAAAATDDAKPAASEEKATAAKPKKAKAVRLTKPWSDMTSLTDQQKGQIAEIHRKAVEEKKQVEQREEAAILAVLNDAQRTEVEALKAKSTTERKMKRPATAEPAAATPAAADKAGSGN